MRMAKDLGGAGWIMTGTLAGQSLIYLSTPAIAQLYGPSSLGAATLFLATAGILAPLLTLRIEFLIPSATDAEASWISRRALWTVLIGSFLAAVVYSLVTQPFNPWVALAFWATSGSIAASGVSIQMLARRRMYRRIGLGKAVNGLGQVGVQIPVGLVAPGSKGIELGFAVGYLLTWGVQSIGSRWRGGGAAVSSARRRALVRSALKLAIAGVMNAVSVWAILILISSFHTAEDAGVFSAVQRLLVTPVGLVTASLLPVVTGGIGRAVRQGHRYDRVLNRWLRILVPVAILMGIVIILVPDDLLLIVLGDEFRGAGAYLHALVPMVVSQIVAGPLGQLLVVTGRATSQLVWDAGRFLLIVGAGVICGISHASPVQMTWILSFIFAFSYLAYVVMVIFYARKGGGESRSSFEA